MGLTAPAGRVVARGLKANILAHLDEAVRLYVEEEEAIVDVGYALGIADSSVRKLLAYAGVELRGPGLSQKTLTASPEILQLAQEPTTFSAIAKAVGISVDSVKRV